MRKSYGRFVHLFRRNFVAGLAALTLPTATYSLPVREELDKTGVKWPMYANKGYGCCVVSSCAQAIRLWTEANKKPYDVPDEYIIRAWAEILGYKPNDTNPAHTKRGVDVVDMLNKWKEGWDIGLLRKSKLINYTNISFKERMSFKLSVDLFGGCILTFLCPENIMNNQTNWCKLGNTKAKRLYGHAVYVIGYDDDFQNCDETVGALKVVSWGIPRYVSWNFIDEYADGAAALLGEEWVSNGVSPNGHSRELLETVMDFTRYTKYLYGYASHH